MAYQVIARKWRSQNFDQIIGQEHIVQTLKNALAQDRLPHALLFTGTRGVGKTSVARLLAKSIRCLQPIDGEACGECSTCLETSSLDIMEIDGASNNGVDAIRELRDSVGYLPAKGKYKVYIIDEVHMLSVSAFNALLKTLEEPPPHVIFIFATTEVHKIPATILSRCQRFDFRRIPARLIHEHLAYICKAEEITADNDSLWAISRQADGSMRDAQSLLDQAISFCGQDLKYNELQAVLGLSDRALLIDTLKALCERDTRKALDVLKRLFQSSYEAKNFCKDLLEELRHLLLVKLEIENLEEVLDLSQAEIQSLKDLANELNEEDIHLLFDMTLKGASDLQRAQDPNIVLEVLLLRLVAAPRILQFFASPSVETSATTEKKTLKSEKKVSLTEKWRDFIEQLKSKEALLAAKLENSSLLSLQDSEVQIGFSEKQKFLLEQLSESETETKLQNYLEAFWGSKLKIQWQKKADKQLSPKEIKELELKKAKEEMMAKIKANPLLQATEKTFKTKITAIKELK